MVIVPTRADKFPSGGKKAMRQKEREGDEIEDAECAVMRPHPILLPRHPSVGGKKSDGPSEGEKDAKRAKKRKPKVAAEIHNHAHRDDVKHGA